MKKFTKYKKENKEKKPKDDIIYEDDIRKIRKCKDNWTFVDELDSVVCIVHLLETNQIILRSEYIPTFEWRDGKEFSVTILSGQIEKGENPSDTILREIQEEAGLVLRDGIEIEMFEPLYISKGTSSKYHPCIISISENDYHEVPIRGDGSYFESKSKSFKLDVKKLSSVKPSDLITSYMINLFFKYLNI